MLHSVRAQSPSVFRQDALNLVQDSVFKQPRYHQDESFVDFGICVVQSLDELLPPVIAYAFLQRLSALSFPILSSK